MMKKLAAASAAVAMTAVLAACGGDGESAGSADSAGTVTFAGWGGVGQEALTELYFEPFSEETGIEVVQDTPVSYSRLEQMVQAGNVLWDVLDYGSEIGLVDNPNLQQLDCDLIACEDFEDGPFPLYPQGVPLYYISFVLTYNTDLVPQTPTTRAEALFDTDTYPGGRAVNGFAGTYTTLLEPALLADGVEQEDLYPLDVERALAKLEEIRDDLVVYQEASECVTLVSSGEAIFGDCYNGRAQLAKEEGLPVDFIWSQQTLAADYAMVAADAPNTDNAMRLIAYMTNRENSGKFSTLLPYAGGNPLSEIPEGFEENSPLANLGEGVHRAIADGSGAKQEWWAENRADVIERMTDWFNE